MRAFDLSAVVLALASTASAHWQHHETSAWPKAQGKSINYTSVAGFFLQDDAATSPTGFDYAENNFGLIDRDYSTDLRSDSWRHVSQWERFARYVDVLNARAKLTGKTKYKLLFMGRHGNGWHNSAETWYGTPAWNCYWAEQTGNATVRWMDAALTPAGVDEALKANAYYKDRYENHNMPHFQSYYTSPMTRCLTTANYTFGDIDLPKQYPFKPTVKEGFREGMTVHTCNERSNKTYIHNLFPRYKFESGFTEDDELWSSEEAETDAAMDVRAKEVLDEVFRSDDKTWISITAHSGIISHLLKALNHRTFRLSTGQIIPVLVKADVIALQADPVYEAHEPYSTCDAPPVTSISGQGCVCSATAAAKL